MNDLSHIRDHNAIIFVSALCLTDGIAHKHPERLFQIEGNDLLFFIFIDFELLVVFEQTGSQIHILHLLIGLWQIQYLIVLAKAIFVKPAIGIVKDHSFGIAIFKSSVIRSSNCLGKRGRVFEGKAFGT